MTRKISKGPDLTELQLQNVSQEHLLVSRNFCFGAAATCLIILLALIPTGARPLALQISVISASFALPLWILMGGVFELYFYLGKRSYPHLRSIQMRFRLFSLGYALAGVGLFTAAGGVIWYLEPEASYAFAASVVIAVLVAAGFQVSLTIWWPGDGGSADSERDE